MSGIEFIVGTVLAAVPIALETYDRSGRVFEVFSVFKQYPREVLILDAKLSNQRTIFRNNAINLLTAITKDRVMVQEVMNQPSSQAARLGLVMASIYPQKFDALNESFVACRQTAEQIHNTLQLLCSQFKAFQVEVGEKKDKMSASEWLKHIRTRFKLGMNKPQIGKAIEELREYNRDFGLITEQITKALQEILNEHKDDPALSRKSARNLNILQRYHRARHASKALHSTLQVRWMCSSHSCHSFDVRILDCDPVKGKGKAPVARYVVCELSITHDSPSYAFKEPLRLEVEQACESDDESTSPVQMVKDNVNLQQLSTILETNADKFKLVAPPVKTSKVHRFFEGFRKGTQQKPEPSAFATQLPKLTQSQAGLSINSQSSTTVAAGSILSSSTLASSNSDLSRVDDFCESFHKAMTRQMGRCLLGSWQGPPAQWFCVPSAPQTARGTSQSLSDIIRWIAEAPVLRSLPRPLLVDLAANVAEGIMQFYSTPWLVATNLGQNVRYINPANSSDFDPVNTSATTFQLKGPYFMARLQSAAAKGKTSAISTDILPVDDAADFTSARNKLLFNFGILLLEIGYGQPWHELKQSVAKTGEKLLDYRAAEKLAQLLVNQMGLTYPKIIKKCLGCDFGLGETDLDNEDLQRRFLEDVVSALQQLREHMRERNFAPPG